QGQTIDIFNSETDELIQIEQTNPGSSVQKEQYIVEKEQQLAQLKAEEKQVQSQLKDLTENDGVIQIESPVSGRVTHLSTGLDNPIMTIRSTDFHVVGELTEAERMAVEAEMDVKIRLVDNDELEPIDGQVDFVSNEPLDVTVNEQSAYPIHVAFNEEPEFGDFLPGYHVDLNITLEEKLNALVINKEHMTDSSIWRMDHSGLLKKDDVEIGIEMGKYIELRNHVTLNDRVAIDS